MLPARTGVIQQHGYIHAGATSAIADTAGRYAAETACSRRIDPVAAWTGGAGDGASACSGAWWLRHGRIRFVDKIH